MCSESAGLSPCWVCVLVGGCVACLVCLILGCWFLLSISVVCFTVLVGYRQHTSVTVLECVIPCTTNYSLRTSAYYYLTALVLLLSIVFISPGGPKCSCSFWHYTGVVAVYWFRMCCVVIVVCTAIVHCRKLCHIIYRVFMFIFFVLIQYAYCSINTRCTLWHYRSVSLSFFMYCT